MNIGMTICQNAKMSKEQNNKMLQLKNTRSKLQNGYDEILKCLNVKCQYAEGTK